MPRGSCARVPPLPLAAVLTLALGIGANLTVFLILYGVLLRPAAVPGRPQQLVRINRLYIVMAQPLWSRPMPGPKFFSFAAPAGHSSCCRL